MVSSVTRGLLGRMEEWKRERRIYKPSKVDTALILLSLLLMPAAVYASQRLLYAALVLTRLGEYRLAALLIFLNNQAAVALVAIATLAAGRVGWPPLLPSEKVSAHAREASLLVATASFALSLARHLPATSPVVVLFPHFWCEYAAVYLAAYAGFSSKPLYLVFSTALLLLGAALEAYLICALG